MPLRGRLYRNDLRVLPDGTRQLHFTDVTEQSGIDAHGYGIGVATGDIDKAEKHYNEVAANDYTYEDVAQRLRGLGQRES